MIHAVIENIDKRCGFIEAILNISVCFNMYQINIKMINAYANARMHEAF